MQAELKRTLILAASAILCAQGSLADDAGGFYFKGFGGMSALQGDAFTFGGTTNALSFDSGIAVGGAFGYQYASTPYRAELEFAYRSGDVADLPAGIGSNGDFASTSVMLNGFYMFETSSKLRPYAGLGIGLVTEIDFDLEGGSGAGEYSDRGGIAYQAMLGLEYPVSDQISLYGEARYFSAGKRSLASQDGASLDADYDTLDLIAGLTIEF